MASNYPTSIDSFTDPLSNSPLNNPSHAAQHQDVNDAVEKLETKLGVGSSPASGAASGDVLVANGSGSTTWQAPAVTAAQFATVGLVYVTSTTVGSAVSSVTVSNVFSSTYDNYEVTFTGGTTSASANFLLSFGSATTEYYGSFYYDLYTGATTATARRSNGADLYIGWTGGSIAGRQQTRFMVASPNKAERTTVTGFNYGGGYSGWFGGEQFTDTAFTSFKIAVSSGTMTGGTITVYGYRKG